MSCWTKQLRPHNTHAGGVIKRRHTCTHHTCIHAYICVYIRYARTVCIHGADPTGPSCSSGSHRSLAFLAKLACAAAAPRLLPFLRIGLSLTGSHLSIP